MAAPSSRAARGDGHKSFKQLQVPGTTTMEWLERVSRVEDRKTGVAQSHQTGHRPLRRQSGGVVG